MPTYYNPKTKKRSNVKPGSTIYSKYKNIKVSVSSPKSKSLKSSSSSVSVAGRMMIKQYVPTTKESYGYTGDWSESSKSLKSVGSGLPPTTQSKNSLYSRIDTFFRGWLPGGISRSSYVSQYSVPALEAKTEAKEQYFEAKDKYESMKQMAKVQDKESDFAYELALMQQELDFKRQEETYSQELDAANQNWWEKFTRQERELELARQNIGQEKEARQILGQIQDLKSVDSGSALSTIKASVPAAKGLSGMGNALLIGGAALVAVFAFKK